MALVEQLGILSEATQNFDVTEIILTASLAVTALAGLVRSYRSLNRNGFDDSIFKD